MEKEPRLKQQEYIVDIYTSTSHTFKNYIHVLKCFFENIRRRKNDMERLKVVLENENLDNMEEVLFYMGELHSIVLKESKEDTLKETEFDLYDQIHKNLIIFRLGKKTGQINLENKLAEQPRYLIKCLKIDFNTLIMNILNNARDEVFIHYKIWQEKYAEGKIEDIENEGAHIIIQGREVDKRYLLFSISNKGRKVPDGMKEKVFERGVTLKSSGNGIGLHDCREIVQNLGGNIWIEDFEDIGSTVCIKIPVIKEKNGRPTC